MSPVRVVEIAGRKLPTHYIQDVLDRIGGIKEFQIEVRQRRPVLRLVPDNGAKLDDIRARIGRYWSGAADVEFISSSELRLLGGRRKFRHLVAASTAPSPPGPPNPLLATSPLLAK